MKCATFRRLLSQACDSGRQLDRAAKEHIEHCTECRDHSNAIKQLEQTLFAKMPSETRCPDELHSRIMRAVRQYSRSAEAIHQLPIFKPMIAAVALTMIAVGLSLFEYMQYSNSKHAARTSPATIESFISASRSPARVIIDTDVEMSARLDAEIAYLKEDIQRAAVFCDSMLGIRMLSMNSE
jgi:hypothetical protein